MATIKEVISSLKGNIQLLEEYDSGDKLLTENDALEKALAVIEDFYGCSEWAEEITWVLERGFGRIDCGACGEPMGQERRKHLYCKSCVEDGCEDAMFGDDC